MFKLISSLIILCLIATPSFAYLGPGISGGAILASIGIVVAILGGLFGLIWFPIKRLLKILKRIKRIK